MTNSERIALVSFVVLTLCVPAGAVGDSARDAAQGILEAAGVRGGLVVHIGCGGGVK